MGEISLMDELFLEVRTYLPYLHANMCLHVCFTAPLSGDKSRRAVRIHNQSEHLGGRQCLRLKFLLEIRFMDRVQCDLWNRWEGNHHLLDVCWAVNGTRTIHDFCVSWISPTSQPCMVSFTLLPQYRKKCNYIYMQIYMQLQTHTEWRRPLRNAQKKPGLHRSPCRTTKYCPGNKQDLSQGYARPNQAGKPRPSQHQIAVSTSYH